MNPCTVFTWTQTDSSGYNSYGAVGIGEPTKILIYNIVPCQNDQIQVYNSKALGAEDVELGTRVRSHVPNVILQIYSLGIATISGAPSEHVCTRASEIVFRFLVYRYRTDHRYVGTGGIDHTSLLSFYMPNPRAYSDIHITYRLRFDWQY